MEQKSFDVIVIGGGSAGLSAALMLGRARRKVLVIDSGTPRNRFAHKMHGVLGRDGTSPAALLSDGRPEVEKYGGVIATGEVTEAAKIDGGFDIVFRNSDDELTRVAARRVIVATGLSDNLLDIPGLAESWGRGTAVCPYCDGYEVKDGRIGILATSPMSTIQAQLLRQWSDQIIYLAHESGAPTGEDLANVQARGIEVVEGEVRQVLSDSTGVTGVELASGQRIELDAIFTAPAMKPRDEVLLALGAKRSDTPMGTFVEVDSTGLTSIPGLWAVGNVVNPALNVAGAIGAGAMTGGIVNHDLVQEDVTHVRALHDAEAK